MEGMNIILLNDTVRFWLFKLSSRKKESPQKLRKEMKTGKDFSFYQIDPVKEIVEFFHQYSISVSVMFDSKASTNALFPEFPILL